MSPVLRLLCALLLLASAAWPVHARRLALVVGNEAYQRVARLDRPVNDAEALAAVLQAAGFEVTLGRDLAQGPLRQVFDDFRARVRGDDEVVVFFAGHGVQTARGAYLLPVDTAGDTEAQVEQTALALQTLLGGLDAARPRHALVVVDACRDNPFRAAGGAFGAARGLTAPPVGRGQVLVLSAGPAQKSLDAMHEADRHPNSVFARELLPRLARPGRSVVAVVNEVRQAVEQTARAARQEQRPQVVHDPADDGWALPSGGPAGTLTAAASGPSVGAPSIAALARPAGPTAAVVAPQPSAGAVVAPQAPAGAGSPAAAVAARAPAPGPAVLTAPAAPPPLPAEPAPAVLPERRTTAYVLPNGDRYEGDVVGSVRTGRGRYTFANGDVYDGDLVDDRFHGAGSLRLASGELYVGDFAHGARHGRGVQTLANGERYDGPFENDKPHGQGLSVMPNGDRYEGGHLNGIRQGHGVYRFASGDRYEGGFVNGQFHGRGRLAQANGDLYDGEFFNGAKQGQGVQHFANRDRYEGAFQQGLQHGQGTHFHANGDRYVGEFAQGLRHGRGVHHFASGETRPMLFVRGVEQAP